MSTGRINARGGGSSSWCVHRIDFIEKASTGILRIRNEARELRCPEPEFEVNGFFTATFWPNPEVRAKGHDTSVTDQVTGQVTDQVAGQVRLLRTISGEMTRLQMQQALGLTHKGHFRTMYLLPALQAGLIEMTIPDKPRSRNQRYRLTPAGRELLTETLESQ